MPLAPFVDVDYNGRISALRTVGLALGLPNAAIPAVTSSGDFPACVYYINLMNATQALPRYTNLDYTGFQRALNDLAAKVP